MRSLEHIDDLDRLMHVVLSLPQVLSLSWSSHDHEARVLSKFLLAAGLTAVQESSGSVDGTLYFLAVNIIIVDLIITGFNNTD